MATFPGLLDRDRDAVALLMELMRKFDVCNVRKGKLREGRGEGYFVRKQS